MYVAARPNTCPRRAQPFTPNEKRRGILAMFDSKAHTVGFRRACRWGKSRAGSRARSLQICGCRRRTDGGPRLGRRACCWRVGRHCANRITTQRCVRGRCARHHHAMCPGRSTLKHAMACQRLLQVKNACPSHALGILQAGQHPFQLLGRAKGTFE